MNNKIGKIFLFKNGKIIDYDLSITLSDLERINKKVKYNERRYIYSSIENKNNLDQIDEFNYYSNYLCNGYSMIRVQNQIEFGDNLYISNEQLLTVLLPETIKKEDSQNIINTYNKIKLNINNFCLKSTHIDEYGTDYDYVYIDKNTYSNFESILKSYINKNMNNLSNEEKEMFDVYYDFDLERILIKSFEKKYPVNNTDAGIIIITKDNIYKRTLRKLQHGSSFKKILGFLYNKNFDNKNMKEMINYNGDILIQLSKGYAIIWVPNEINNYQLNELKKINKQIKDINKRNNNIINYGVEVADNTSKEILSSAAYNSIDEYLNNLNMDNIFKTK